VCKRRGRRVKERKETEDGRQEESKVGKETKIDR
jgi:hypothetical protein